MAERKFKQTFQTRWLSFEEAADALLQNYDALVTCMKMDSAKCGDPVATGLLNFITDFSILPTSYIIGTNLLTKFHEDWKINVASRVLTRKTAPPPGSHTNLLTKFYEDRKINVASKVKNAPTPSGHVFQPTSIILELVQDIIGMNLLTKFHEDWTINVASRKNAPPLDSHVFQAKVTIFKLIQDIIGTNLLTKFHEVASRVLTRKKNVPWRPCFSDIIGMNLLTKFYRDQTINVASRVFTRFNYSHIRKTAPPLGSHVFQAKITIFELIQDIIETNLLTKFHEDRKIYVASRVLTRFYYSLIAKNAPPPGGHVFQPTGIIFKLGQDIIGMNLLTKFYEDQTINVASRVFTRFYYSHIRKNAPPLGSHVFEANVTIFELIQDIIETNLLTKIHEDRKINVASRVFKRKNAPPPGCHVMDSRAIQLSTSCLQPGTSMENCREAHDSVPSVLAVNLTNI
ncbi:hypothetical protein DPMN_002003 [Dreissena polymorpha]|uniref:Uncharacterized protein n=1 Tax=Dreissena polymorpha TaxID=45954 RepID=A0A9D4MLE1_DREPO|nr:hypothetical protein DPMN_002003 [Dreissena polymorpha]